MCFLFQIQFSNPDNIKPKEVHAKSKNTVFGFILPAAVTFMLMKQVWRAGFVCPNTSRLKSSLLWFQGGVARVGS